MSDLNTWWTKLSQWGWSNRPRIRPGTVKSLNAPWEFSQLALRRDYAKKIDPFRMLVWLGRRTVPQDRVSTRCYLAGRYKLGRSCLNSNLLRPRVKDGKFSQENRFEFCQLLYKAKNKFLKQQFTNMHVQGYKKSKYMRIYSLKKRNK